MTNSEIVTKAPVATGISKPTVGIKAISRYPAGNFSEQYILHSLFSAAFDSVNLNAM